MAGVLRTVMGYHWKLAADCLVERPVSQPLAMSDELIQRVRSVIATTKRIPLETVSIDSSFEQLGLDSMDAVEILFALENEFDINIPDDDVRAVRNVRQMAEGVEKLLTAKSADAAASQ